MKGDFAEIFLRLESLRTKAEAMRKEHGEFLQNIAEIEEQLEQAREHLDAAQWRFDRMAGDGKPL